MARIESSIHVSKSIEDVFAFLSKRDSHRKFIPRMTELRQTSSGVFEQPGTKLAGMLNYFGVRIPVQYEIMEVQQNHSLAMKGQMGPVQFKDGYVLSRNEKGSEVKFWLELIPQGWVKLFSPFMGVIGKIHAWETLRNLEREIQKTGG
jgi:hypothetical protein